MAEKSIVFGYWRKHNHRYIYCLTPQNKMLLIRNECQFFEERRKFYISFIFKTSLIYFSLSPKKQKPSEDLVK